MLARQSLRLSNLLRHTQFAAVRSFSANNEGGAEWGIKYDDECLKFEKEWAQIADKVDKEQMVFIEKELSDLQQKKVDMLADKILDLNVFEMRYLSAKTKERLHRTSGINPLKINMDWPSVK